MKIQRINKSVAGTCMGFLLLTLLSSSCNQPSNRVDENKDSKEVAAEHNKAKFDERSDKKDAEFMVEASEINLKEISLGKLALERSLNSDVKELARMMVDAHTKTQTALRELAAKKQISVPDSITQNGRDDWKKLNDKNGRDFDKEYCDMMASGHKDAISKFEKVSTDSKDADIRNWAAETLPALRRHLDHVTLCQEKCNKMK
jgi:putative membrane protein